MPKSIKIDQFRYMTSESWRILMAVEMGMKNHEFVPSDLVHKISRCARRGSSFAKLLRDDLVPHGLLAYETDNRKGYSGYRLTNLGYDYLALHALIKSGQVIDLGSMIGVGKESDVYLAVAGDSCGRQCEELDGEEKNRADLPSKGDYIVIKFHRLGRTSFRKVREKREYHQGRNTCSWLYLDRLAAKREFEMMQILYDYGLPVPCPLANNRNAVVMSLVSDAVPLCKVLPTTLRANNGALANILYAQAVEILEKITSNGLIHGDFNEFNLLIGGLAGGASKDSTAAPDDGDTTNDVDLDKVQLILIDFPQMISRDHRNAQEIYERDLNGIVGFFDKFLELDPTNIPPKSLLDIPRTGSMDVDLKAPGYIREKPSKRSAGRRVVEDSDLLVGTVAALALNDDRSETSSEEEEITDSGEDEEDEEAQDVDAEVQGSSAEYESALSHEEEESASSEGFTTPSMARCNLGLNNKTASQTIISRDEVRERRKREEKKRMQNEFRLRIKRQQRASTKNKSRAEIIAETKLFA
uniref:non-specific serine/threonine protein kinase n=1 Tax=Mesocestoides corti TaxID=53468 RepID=A0A5K3F4V2_MESCO